MPEEHYAIADLQAAVDYIRDLAQQMHLCNPLTWGRCLKELLEFCENHPIMMHITEPLFNKEVGVNYQLDPSRRPYNLSDIPLPDALEERLPFIYQVLLRIGPRFVSLGASGLAGQEVFLGMVQDTHNHYARELLDTMIMRMDRLIRSVASKQYVRSSELYLFED